MKVFINGWFVSQPQNGIQRFAIELLNALDKILDDIKIEFIVLVPFDTNIKYKNIKIEVIKPIINHQFFWDNILLTFRVRNQFLINLCNFAPLFRKNQLVVVHDIIPIVYPESCSFIWKSYYKINLALALKRSKFLVTVSEFTKKEILNHFLFNRDIFVIPNSAEHFQANFVGGANDQTCDIENGKFILLVSSQANVFHKNFALVLSTVKLFDCNFLAVGNGDSSDNLHFLGRVADHRLYKLYSLAYCFIFPSLYEGFGIPPLEAMTCGCPVVVSDIPVMHEVCGDAAIYFNPHDANSLRDAVEKLKDEKLRNELIQKGYERVKLFSWQQSAQKLLDIILYANES